MTIVDLYALTEYDVAPDAHGFKFGVRRDLLRAWLYGGADIERIIGAQHRRRLGFIDEY